MIFPGPWFYSKVREREGGSYCVISPFSASEIGKYASQNPQKRHGGYLVATTTDTVMARHLLSFPPMVRVMNMLRSNLAVCAAIEEIDHDLYTAFATIKVPNEETPTKYKMLDNKWEQFINPKDYPNAFKSALAKHEFTYLCDEYDAWEKNHPFGKANFLWNNPELLTK